MTIAAQPPPLFPFPRESQYAQALFQEACRHLVDARVLHVARRYAASITSTMKTVELGLKASIVLYGGNGWLDSALLSHNVFAELKKWPIVTQSFLDSLQTHDPKLPADLELLERLIPLKPDLRKLEYDEAVNTEYPFFAFVTGANPSLNVSLYMPGQHFSQTDSARHFQTARRLILALQTLSPEIAAWNVRLSRSL